MEKSSPQNQPRNQAKRIELEELEPIALQVRKRAIEARSVAMHRSVQTSSYNLGGWGGLFEENLSQPPNFNMELNSIASSNKYPHTESSFQFGSSNLETMPLCPSSRPELNKSVVFGVVGGTVETPQVSYLSTTLAVNENISSLSGSVEPTEIFRIASTCAGNNCKHFDGSECRLAAKIVEELLPVVEALPACQIRSDCRWWKQEGKAACQRCPQVVTDNYYQKD